MFFKVETGRLICSRQCIAVPSTPFTICHPSLPLAPHPLPPPSPAPLGQSSATLPLWESITRSSPPKIATYDQRTKLTKLEVHLHWFPYFATGCTIFNLSLHCVSVHCVPTTQCISRYFIFHSRVIRQINVSAFERLNAFDPIKMYFPFTQYNSRVLGLKEYLVPLKSSVSST